MYHEKRKRAWLDRLMVIVVVIIAGVVVLLSFHNTATLAEELKLNPYGTAFLVELLFATLLGIRARQRATERNVPQFIHYGFYASFIFVTVVNMYGLAKENPVVGAVVGLAISGAMWLMENTLVWLWTESDQPHKKTVRELMKEAKREIKEMKIRQKIEWMKWEAQKPDLNLIREARKAEEKRKKVVADGLPEYLRPVYTNQPANIPVATVKETEETVDNQPVDTMQTVESIQPENTNQPVHTDQLTSIPVDTVNEKSVDTELTVDNSEETVETVQPAYTVQPVGDTEKTVDTGQQATGKTVEETVDATESAVDTDQLEQKVFEKAWEIYRQEGKPPGRVRLERETGCTQHLARKVSKQVKEQIEENQKIVRLVIGRGERNT